MTAVMTRLAVALERRRAELLSVALAVLILGSGCGRATGGRTGNADTCPEMQPGYLPAGFEEAQRTLEGDPPHGVLVVYRDAGGREVGLLSGVPSDPHGMRATGRTVRVRGHEAEVLTDERTATRRAVWLEADPAEPCAQYSISGVGLSDEEFDRIASEID